MKRPVIENFKVVESTATRLCVELTPTLRLYGQRHSNRYSGASVWETLLYQYGKWRVFDNPFDRNDFHIVEKWGAIREKTFRGVRIVNDWAYKADIIAALNNIPV